MRDQTPSDSIVPTGTDLSFCIISQHFVLGFIPSLRDKFRQLTHVQLLIRSNSGGYRVDDLSDIGHAQDQIDHRDSVINRIVPGVNRNDSIG